MSTDNPNRVRVKKTLRADAALKMVSKLVGAPIYIAYHPGPKLWKLKCLNKKSEGADFAKACADMCDILLQIHEVKPMNDVNR